MVASYSPFELPVCLVGKFTLDGQGAQEIGKKKKKRPGVRFSTITSIPSFGHLRYFFENVKKVI